MRLRLTLALAVLAAQVVRAQSQEGPTPEELQRRIDDLQHQLQQVVRAYDTQMRELQAQLAVLQAQAPAPRDTTASSGRVVPAAVGAGPGSSLNPSLSVLPDFTASAGGDPRWAAGDAVRLRELELALSASIDPYAKAFVALSVGQHAQAEALYERFSDHGHAGEAGHDAGDDHGYSVEVEEAYALFPALPGGFSGKAGRFYAALGKENGLHTHAWALADRPLALELLLGGEGHGLADVGVSVNRLLPTPWVSDLTFEVTGGRTEGLFDGGRGDLAYLAAWRSYWDLTADANLELVASATAGKNAHGKTARLADVSATFRWRPGGSARQSLLWRTEYLEKRYPVWEDQGPEEGEPSEALLVTERSRGLFSYVDWQFTRGWYLGARADWVRHPEGLGEDRGVSLALTWAPSEFQRLRLQAQRTRYAALGSYDAVILQYGFSLGPHGAHPF